MTNPTNEGADAVDRDAPHVSLTLYMPLNLKRAAKVHAIEAGTTVSALVIALLSTHLGRAKG